MRILVTGSSGHLGEALVRVLGRAATTSSASTSSRHRGTAIVGSVADRAVVRRAIEGVDAVLHAATLHKPHVGSHRRQDFVDTNVTGTLNLLEEAVATGVGRFVFTSTTSDVRPRARRRRPARPRRGSPRTSCRCRRTSTAPPRSRRRTSASSSTATMGCRAWSCGRRASSPRPTTATTSAPPTTTPTSRSTSCCTGGSTSRTSSSAHRLALDRAPSDRLRPLHHQRDDALHARGPRRAGRGRAGRRAAAVPRARGVYAARGWRMFPTHRSRLRQRAGARELGWAPRHDFAAALERLRRARTRAAPLALAVGAKGYHAESFGPYTTR